MKITVRKFISVLMTVVMCFALFSVAASAALENATGHITINAFDHENNLPLEGMTFRLYFVATAREDGDKIVYDYRDEFRDNGMSIDSMGDPYFPIHLTAYAEKYGFSYIENKTDATGAVEFLSLRCGIYLAVSGSVDEIVLNPLPFIITIPMYDENPDDHIFDVTANPKITIKHEMPGYTYVNVKKQWEDDGSHPESISVTLMRDGIAIDTVELSESNGWSFRWDDLPVGHAWSVVETDVPDGYEVSYDVSQLTVTITNTAVTEDSSEEITTRPDEITTKPEETSQPDKLVQTGQLNWPVPVLAMAGLLLFSAGWAIVNFGKKEEEVQ